MDSTGFAGLAGRYTVVTYDPRGIGNSRREGAGRDVTPEQQAEDVHPAAALHEHSSATADEHCVDCFAVLADPDSAIHRHVSWASRLTVRNCPRAAGARKAAL